VIRINPVVCGHSSRCAGANGIGKVVHYTRTSQGADVFAYDSASSNGLFIFT
jgi:hypothetical protein